MNLVLAGAGYAHLLLLRDWQQQAAPELKLTLISPFTQVPYSGMLPACIGGQYTHADIHIDVQALCERTGATLVIDELCGIDPNTKQVMLATQTRLSYDLLSLNTGPAADESVPGVHEHAIAVKPVSRFLPRWLEVNKQLRGSVHKTRIVVVGGGAGSVEIIIAMVLALEADTAIQPKPEFTLLTGNKEILPGYPKGVRRAALKRCEALGIKVTRSTRVARVDARLLHAQDASTSPIAYDYLFWCAQAASPHWLLDSGLACDAAGFLQVGPTLQSCSDPSIFASGDIAAFTSAALPKAGVFSVRQAPVLSQNLKHAAQHKALIAYQAQTRFLSLLSLGPHYAAGSYGPLTFCGRWVRAWKAHIDRRFMDSLN